MKRLEKPWGNPFGTWSTNKWCVFHIVHLPQGLNIRDTWHSYIKSGDMNCYTENPNKHLQLVQSSHWFLTIFWLVVDLPLWKIVVTWDDDIPNWMEKKHVPNHQPVIIRCWNQWTTHLFSVDPKPGERWWSQRKMVVSYCWGNGWFSLIFRHVFWQHQEKFMVLLSED